ncbi:hypothetical protein KKF84_20470, partial [Myxococcota bacterium]|nr:hypothetical protein [Myxococcota bacterium]
KALGELPPVPPDMGLILRKEQHLGKASSWNLMIPLGLSREKLVDLLEWFEGLQESMGDMALYDPQLGRKLTLPDDDEALLEGILSHDAWILENVGGSSMGSPDESTPLLPPRTKLVLWFSLAIILLYFLTRFMLSSYFSS